VRPVPLGATENATSMVPPGVVYAMTVLRASVID
jgi:hypothetical protein